MKSSFLILSIILFFLVSVFTQTIETQLTFDRIFEPVIIDDPSYKNIISYLWWYNDIFRLVVVNYSSNHAKAHIRLKQINFNLEDWNFTDLLHQKNYSYKGKDLDEFGLYIDLNAWDGHIFDIKKE